MGISKAQMRDLMNEVRPDMPQEEFDMRFRRIDEDGSGMIEFDEFVTWVREDEVRIVGASARKMSFEELAGVYNQTVPLIRYLYDCFVDALPPDGEEDQYPDDCVGL